MFPSTLLTSDHGQQVDQLRMRAEYCHAAGALHPSSRQLLRISESDERTAIGSSYILGDAGQEDA